LSVNKFIINERMSVPKGRTMGHAGAIVGLADEQFRQKLNE
jgi:hypothetical protein